MNSNKDIVGQIQQVDKLPLGVWMEFQGVEAQSIRCSLAG